MNADRLLQHFGQMADAPDAIARLRRFVLDLAVRGKLVPQDANDEPASELLKRIAKEKARLVKAREIKKEKPLSPVDDDADFDVPATWRWTRLGIVTSYIQRGKSPKYAASDGSLVVSQKCVQWRGLDLSVAKQVTLESLADYEDIRFLRDGDLLWNSTGTGTIGRVIRLVRPPDKLVCDSHVTVVRCLEADPEYICIWLRSDHVYALIEDRAAGSTNQVELTAQMAIKQVVPLPPLAEQHRIVAKVDELMGLCDRLEAARAGGERTRDRLVAASLARLNAPDPETFQTDARFALDALPALTTRPDQIKRLRQTILNLAVRGTLVPQDAYDEPALDYLLRLDEVDSKARKQLKPLNPSDCGGDMPASWVWLPLGAIIRTMDAGWSPQCESHPRSSVDEWGVLKTTAVQALTFDPMQHKLLPARLKPRPEFQAEVGDILVTRAGPKNRVGVSCVVDVPCPKLMISDKLIRFHAVGDLSPRYIALTLNAGHTFDQIEAAKSGMAVMQMNISQNKLRAIPVPLPPLAEQHRIVAKVDALMALCDRLEASLTATAATRRRLLDALLAEALTSADDRKLEAAE